MFFFSDLDVEPPRMIPNPYQQIIPPSFPTSNIPNIEKVRIKYFYSYGQGYKYKYIIYYLRLIQLVLLLFIQLEVKNYCQLLKNM